MIQLLLYLYIAWYSFHNLLIYDMKTPPKWWPCCNKHTPVSSPLVRREIHERNDCVDREILFVFIIYSSMWVWTCGWEQCSFGMNVFPTPSPTQCTRVLLCTPELQEQTTTLMEKMTLYILARSLRHFIDCVRTSHWNWKTMWLFVTLCFNEETRSSFFPSF